MLSHVGLLRSPTLGKLISLIICLNIEQNQGYVKSLIPFSTKCFVHLQEDLLSLWVAQCSVQTCDHFLYHLYVFNLSELAAMHYY